MSDAAPAAPARPIASRRRGAGPARRVMVRWAWRLFRREWRRQALVLALLTLAVAATTLGLAVASSAATPKADPDYGTANTIISLPASDPELAADLASLRSRFPGAAVVEHQSIPIPGSVSTVDVRAEDPSAPSLRPTIRLDGGHFPTGPTQIAVTSRVADEFGIHLGGTWEQGGQTFQVVGVVEDPLDLNFQFALVAPNQLSAPDTVAVLVTTGRSGVEGLNLHAGADVSTRGTSGAKSAEVGILVLATLGLLFVGLLAAAGFTVMAQRRMRALGMLGSLGATDNQVRLAMLANGAVVGVTAALVGALAALVAWLAVVSHLQSIAARRIDRFALPWWAIGAAVALAVLTATTAAWWPARAAARVPVVAALSGRPPRPRPARHFASAGAFALGAGLAMLVFSDDHRPALIVGGIVVTVVGTLLLAPVAIRALPWLGRRTPVAIRMALRDLARYQARSGAALGAVVLAIGIATTVAVTASANGTASTAGNLAANQLVVYLAPNGAGSPLPTFSAAQLAAAQSAVDHLATAVRARAVVPLEEAFAAQTKGVPSGPDGPGPASLSRVVTSGNRISITEVLGLYVATPAVLAQYGITPSEVDPNADILTSRSGLGGLQIFDPILAGPPDAKGAQPGGAPSGASPSGAAATGASAGSAGRDATPPEAAHPVIQRLAQLPVYTSAPTALITPHAMAALGLVAQPSGWMLETAGPLTTSQVDSAQKSAAASGLYTETRPSSANLAKVRNYSTLAGVLLALGVLATTVGLIRSEAGNDLRILTANGANAAIRRALTAATAGALAFEGSMLAIACAYLALIAWHRSNLHALTNVPLSDLAVLLLGLPVLAAAGAWLVAGSEPATISRRPLD